MSQISAENTPQTFARSFVILVVHSGMAKSKLIYLHIYICAIIVLYVMWNIGITKFNKVSIVLINQQY